MWESKAESSVKVTLVLHEGYEFEDVHADAEKDIAREVRHALAERIAEVTTNADVKQLKIAVSAEDN